ncbi:hypothetical protein HDU90_003361 [Geranomyces variabilis]|nr:hypothetical protein HDU90_003361 [Geranomyces variabilis]
MGLMSNLCLKSNPYTARSGIRTLEYPTGSARNVLSILKADLNSLNDNVTGKVNQDGVKALFKDSGTPQYGRLLAKGASKFGLRMAKDAYGTSKAVAGNSFSEDADDLEPSDYEEDPQSEGFEPKSLSDCDCCSEASWVTKYVFPFFERLVVDRSWMLNVVGCGGENTVLYNCRARIGVDVPKPRIVTAMAPDVKTFHIYRVTWWRERLCGTFCPPVPSMGRVATSEKTKSIPACRTDAGFTGTAETAQHSPHRLTRGSSALIASKAETGLEMLDQTTGEGRWRRFVLPVN